MQLLQSYSKKVFLSVKWGKIIEYSARLRLKSWAAKVIFFLLNHTFVQKLPKQWAILIGLGSLINYAKPDQLIICASLGIKKRQRVYRQN